MNHLMKLGLLSSVLSATLFADVPPDVPPIVESNATIISQTQTDITLRLTDAETNEPITSNVNFDHLRVDAGSKIGAMQVLSDGNYAFSIRPEIGCEESNNSEINGIFSVTINDADLEVPYTLCQRDDSHFETAHPYSNNTHQEKILIAQVPQDIEEYQYLLTIQGETERNYDFITITDLSGNTLKRLRLSGVLDKTVTFSQAELPEGKLKVVFTSDNIITKEGVTVDLDVTYAIAPTITSLGDAEHFEGARLYHEVIMSEDSIDEQRYAFSIEDNTTTPGDDYDPIPTFSASDDDSDPVDVHYDPETSEVVVGAGVSHFHINIQTLFDEDDNEPTESYEIHLDDKQASGFIYNNPR